MKVLVAFGTTEGQTKKIADHIASTARAAGNEVETYDCAGHLSGQDFGSFDAIIVAGSVHQKLHQIHVAAFAAAHRQQLDTVPSAFVSVSLSACFEDGKAEARDYVEGFVQDTGWRPQNTHLAGGALRYTEYDYFKEHIVRHVVMDGRDLPVATQDYELTDWDALDKFMTAFLESASSRVS